MIIKNGNKMLGNNKRDGLFKCCHINSKEQPC